MCTCCMVNDSSAGTAEASDTNRHPSSDKLDTVVRGEKEFRTCVEYCLRRRALSDATN